MTVNYCLVERKCGQMLRDMPKAAGTKNQLAGKDSSGNPSVVLPEKQVKPLPKWASL
jgi:hypothetical protein